MRRIIFLLLALSTIAFPLGAEAQQIITVQNCGALPRPNSLGSAGSIAIDVNGNVCVPPVSVAVSTPSVQLATPVAVNMPIAAQVVSGAFSDGAITAQGSQADTAWGGSGAATVIAALKGIYNAIKTISVTTTIPTPLAVTVTNTPLAVSASVTIPTPLAVTVTNTPLAVTQGVTPWIVGTVTPLSVSSTVTIPTPLAVTVVNTPLAVTASVSIPTPLAVTVTNTPLAVTQSVTPWIIGVITPIGVTQSTTPWVVSGNALTVTALEGTTPWVVTGNALVTQSTTPWQVAFTSVPAHTVTALEGTSPWVVTGNALVTQSTTPWQVAINSALVNQGTSPWVVNVSTAQTVPVSPSSLAVWGLGIGGNAAPSNETLIAGVASSSESPVQSSGTLSKIFVDLVGKLITSPYANRENMVRGSAALNGTANTTLLSATTGNLKNYVTDLSCMRSDAGTTAMVVTTNDVTSTTSPTAFVLPNNGGGGGFIKNFNVPLVTAANTAFLVAATSSVAGVQCTAEGFTGY